MKLLLTISLRNLFRQQRRSILLGIAIAFGTMILIVANSFSSGVSDVLFNKIISYVAGHVNVSFAFSKNIRNRVFYDKQFMDSLIRDVGGDIIKTTDEALGIFSRVVGNGKSDNLILIGMDMRKNITQEEMDDLLTNFRPVSGSLEDLKNDSIENPGFISFERAEVLKIKTGDIVRARFQDLNGQNQAARITIVGIFKPTNSFMQSPLFLELQTVRKLLGYSPSSTGPINLTVTNPKKNAKRLADKLHTALKPKLAVIPATVRFKTQERLPMAVMGYRTDSGSCAILNSFFRQNNSTDPLFTKTSINLIQPSAHSLAINNGDSAAFSYEQKYSTELFHKEVIVNTILIDSVFTKSTLLLPEKLFFELYYGHWPKAQSNYNEASLLRIDSLQRTALSNEWILEKRSRTTKEVSKKFRELRKYKSDACIVDVGSMYENASAILQMETALNMITFTAVLVLFFIILIGVINSLRMTIRERTREIGTIRAIGMQKNDVRNSFLLETFFLALIAALVGTGGAFLLMTGLSMITIDAKENPLGMLLVNKHLHFFPSVISIVFFILLIIFIAVATAYFPARRAARLSAVEALRHYE